jgi:hypothetical protein
MQISRAMTGNDPKVFTRIFPFHSSTFSILSILMAFLLISKGPGLIDGAFENSYHPKNLFLSKILR